MKSRKIFYLLTYSLCILFLCSCDTSVGTNFKDSDDNIKPRPLYETFVRNGFTYIAGDVKITCGSDKCTGGNVGPSEKCQLASDMNGNYECSCSGCKMTIWSDVKLENHEVSDQFEIDNNDEYAKDFIIEKHNEEFFGFQSVSYHFSPDRTIAIYEYELLNGDVETVMFVNTYDSNGALKKKFVIDCTGTCGCREQYNHNTGISSCSCDECEMEVTEVEEKTQGN